MLIADIIQFQPDRIIYGNWSILLKLESNVTHVNNIKIDLNFKIQNI